MEEDDNSNKSIENKPNEDRNLIVRLEIFEINKMSTSPSPFLRFKSSNYNLSRDEQMRATVRPKRLTLDNKFVYIKSDNDSAYFDEELKTNILEVHYCLANHKY
jgi:hypothetical protein